MSEDHKPIARRVWTGIAVAALLLCTTETSRAWDSVHGARDNSGFADVLTKAAASGSVTIPNIGTFAPGVGPVVAPDGNVYIGNEQGKLWAFHADGSPYWSRDITSGQTIVASPLIDSEGNVYVIGVKSVRDHTVTPTVTRLESTLHKFTGGGGWLHQTAFPQHADGGATTAAPNIWKYNGMEAIIAPIAYPNPVTAGYETRVVAFDKGGQVLADARVDVLVPSTYSDTDYPEWQVALCMVPPFLACLTPTGFRAPGHRQVIQPLPTPAIFTYQGGGTPFILVADGFQSLVGFTFDNNTFTEIFRVRNDTFFRTMTSTPMVTPDGHTIVSSPAGMIFAGPNMNALPTVTEVHSYGAPTRLPNGKVVVVTGRNDLAVLQGATVEQRIPLAGESIASAAASRNHLFVSSADAFTTFDVNTLQQVAKVDWVGGGVSPPAIGPTGHVYAIASNILFVFPAPIQVPMDTGLIAQPPQGAVATDPAQPTALPPQQLYTPPLTTSGNRLFACLELDGDDCGKGDYREISLAFCQKQGFTQAYGFDVDARKVKAETLDGHFCSKKKCKVFDSIGCKN